MNTLFKKTFILFPLARKWLVMPAFTAWISLSFGIVLARWLPVLNVSSLYNSGMPYAIFLSLFIALICKNLKIRVSVFFIIGFLLFSLQTQREYHFYSRLKIFLRTTEPIHISGRLISAPLLSKGKYSYLIEAERLYANTDTLQLQGKIIKCISYGLPSSYGTITCSGQFHAPRPPANPYAFNEHSYLLANRIWGRFTIDSLITISPATSFISHITHSARATVLKTISHVNDVSIQGILQAAFLGEKKNLTADTKSVFREAGIYHLLAISGLHVAILISSMLLVLRLFPLSRVVKILLTILFIWCYLFFIGLIPSLFRAVIMATLILFSTICQRNSYAVNSLGAAGIIWLIMSPTSIFTPGYQLSFAATFGIITLYPVFKDHFIPPLQNLVAHLTVKTVLSPFSVSLAGFIATTPILIYHFGRISLFGLIANILAVFLMAFAMNTFFLGIVAQMVWEPCAILIMRIAEFFLSLIIRIAELSHFFPYASIKVPVPYSDFFIMYSFIFLGLATINKKYFSSYIRWIFPCLFFLLPLSILYHNAYAYSEVVFFSTKGGSLTGIRFPNRKIWLVSSMTEKAYSQTYKNAVEPWMHHLMVKDFDAVFLPVVTQNVVHHLDQILADNIPNSIITCNAPEDEILKEDFHSFLQNYSINHIEAKNRWQFIPSPQCTCTIYKKENNEKWYEKSNPASLKFSLGSTQILFNNAGYALSNMNSENRIIQINNTTVYSTDPVLKRKFLQYKTPQHSPRIVSTESDGAVIFRINNNGIVKVKAMQK